MMNVCIMSNSHAASLKDGWETISDRYPMYKFTFFAVANRGMGRLRADLENKTFSSADDRINEMLSVTSGGLESINVADYDAFLVYGLFLSYPKLDVRLSNAVKQSAISDGIAGSINHRFVRELNKMSSVPIYYGAEPLESTGTDEMQMEASPKLHTYSEVASWTDDYYAPYSALRIDQPSSTIGSNLNILEKYSAGSRRLLGIADETEFHTKRDTRHANAKYGACYIEESLLPRLSSHLKIAA